MNNIPIHTGSASILAEADGLVNGDRQAAYGSPSANFGRWSDLCAATGRERVKALTPEDLAWVMVLGKIARDTNSPKRDNLVDGAAYLELVNRLRGE